MKVKQLLPLLDCVVKLYDRMNSKYYDGMFNDVPMEYRDDDVRCIEANYVDIIDIYTDKEATP